MRILVLPTITVDLHSDVRAEHRGRGDLVTGLMIWSYFDQVSPGILL